VIHEARTTRNGKFIAPELISHSDERVARATLLDTKRTGPSWHAGQPSPELDARVPGRMFGAPGIDDLAPIIEAPESEAIQAVCFNTRNLQRIWIPKVGF
jgi:hypothetical protein